jgi:hypothetical protein
MRKLRRITVDVEVDLDDVIEEMDDQDFIDILETRGYTVIDGIEEDFEKEDWNFLIEMLDKQPYHWYNNRVRDKLVQACYG